MDLDLRLIRENFRSFSRDDILEKIALRLDTWTPPPRMLLEGEARDRGITPGDPDYPAGEDAWPEDGDWWKTGPAS